MELDVEASMSSFKLFSWQLRPEELEMLGSSRFFLFTNDDVGGNSLDDTTGTELLCPTSC